MGALLVLCGLTAAAIASWRGSAVAPSAGRPAIFMSVLAVAGSGSAR